MGRQARKRHPRSPRPWSGSSWWGGQGEETEGGSHAGQRRVPPPGQPQAGEGQAVQVPSGRCTLAGKSPTRLRTQNEEQGGRGRLRGFVVARSGPPWPTAQEGPAEGRSPPHRHTQASGRLGRQLRRAWLSKGLGPCPRCVVCHGAAWGCDTPLLGLGHTWHFLPKGRMHRHTKSVFIAHVLLSVAPARGREWGLCGKGLEELQCPPRGAPDPCRPEVC